MAPLKKQKPNKSPKKDGKLGKNKQNIEMVVSGQLQTKLNKKSQKPPKNPKGVVFIKRLPHGFFEEQLKKYFEQFGHVTRVRLARSRLTGRSKGFAFVEFEYPEVAQVAAETMNNYLMFKQIVKASYIPPEKQNFNYFRTSVKQIRNKSGKLIWISQKTNHIHRTMKKYNDWSAKNYQKRTEKQLQKLKKIGEKYTHLGIDISKLIVQPEMLTEKKKNLPEKSKVDRYSKEIKSAITKNNVSSSKTQNIKKYKNKGSLEDLLGDSIEEDSKDEDYTNSREDTGESEDSSDEEEYDDIIISDDKDSQVNSENETDENVIPILSKKSKNIPKKSVKTSKININRSQNKLSLKDLLNETIEEDSDDDDFVYTNSEESSGESNESSDEESYDRMITLDNDDIQANSKIKIDEDVPPILSKKLTNKKKSVKTSNIERVDQILKRKPLLGSINKLDKKPLNKQKIAPKRKNSLQLTAAKELAKPLSQIKTKLNVPLRKVNKGSPKRK